MIQVFKAFQAGSALTLEWFRLGISSLRWLFWRWHYWRVRGRMRTWEVQGDCNGCGICCSWIQVRFPRWLTQNRLGNRLMQAWASKTRPYLKYRGQMQDGTAVFRCLYQGKNLECTIYEERPEVCRNYPHRLSLLREPVLFRECSYEVHPRDPLIPVHALRKEPPDLIQIEDLPSGRQQS